MSVCEFNDVMVVQLMICSVSQDSSAFVFGLLSFCDKLAGGAAILIVQLFCPCAYVRSLVLLVMLLTALIKL